MAFGDAQYKAVFGNREWQESSIYLFSPTVRGMRLGLLRASIMLLDDHNAQVLRRIGPATTSGELICSAVPYAIRTPRLAVRVNVEAVHSGCAASWSNKR